MTNAGVKALRTQTCLQFLFIRVGVLFLIGTPGFAGAEESGAQLVKPVPSQAMTEEKVARVPTAADDQSNARILNNLAKQSGWFPALKIGVSNGMVSIEGHVQDAEQLAWLAKTADRLPTVIAVINKAQVDTPAVTDLTPAWKEFTRLMNRVKQSLPLLALAIFLIAAFYYFGKYLHAGVRSVWRQHITNPFLLSTVSKITMVPIWAIFLYLTLQTAGLSGLATTIIGGTGAVGIVLGFAFKDIAGNYLSGLLLAIRSPFTKGDDIQVAGFDGYVQSLNMRGTTILDYDGNLILIPNAIVIQSVIRNRTTNANSRLLLTIGIGHADSFAKAQELIQQALKETPAVLNDPAPIVVAGDLKASTLNVQVYFWIDSVKSSSLKVKSAVLTHVKELLLANGISLPDDNREIVFTDAIKVRLLDAGDSAAANVPKIPSVGARDQQETSTTKNSEMRQLGDQVDMLDRSNRLEPGLKLDL